MKKKYSADLNSVVDVYSVVDEFSGVYEYTIVDENSVVCKSSGKMVDENSDCCQFGYFLLIKTNPNYVIKNLHMYVNKQHESR